MEYKKSGGKLHGPILFSYQQKNFFFHFSVATISIYLYIVISLMKYPLVWIPLEDIYIFFIEMYLWKNPDCLSCIVFMFWICSFYPNDVSHYVYLFFYKLVIKLALIIFRSYILIKHFIGDTLYFQQEVMMYSCLLFVMLVASWWALHRFIISKWYIFIILSLIISLNASIRRNFLPLFDYPAVYFI